MFKHLLATAACLCVITPAFADEILQPQVEQIAADAASDKKMIDTDAIRIDRDALIALLQTGKVNGQTIGDQEGIYSFYKNRDFAVFWTDGKGPSKRAEQSIGLIEKSWEDGLNPLNYSLPLLQEKIASKENFDVVAFEVLMSNAMAKYGRDMTGMRVSAKKIEEDTRSWRKGWSTEQVLNYLAEGKNPDDLFAALSPDSKLYPVLKKQLIDLVDDIRKDPERDAKPIAFPGLIYPHKKHPAVGLIRSRFRMETKADMRDIYDDKLVDRVKEFQKDSGLKPDGVIGQRTIDALNKSRRDQVVQIMANMERLRWMSPELPSKYIMVNVPAMTLWAFEDNKIEFEMPVIVGKPDWQTTSFKTEITGIRFNPSWYVPPSIKTKDLLPELQRNPDALTKKNLQLLYYTSDGAKPISPRDVNWANVTESDLKNFAMIQNPGDENPLGKIRVLMPNQYNIYLHDTNSPDLFTKDYRALSHGCIRLAEPRKVAGFILDQNPDWNEDRLNNILSKKNTIEVAATSTIPVFILYQTIWQDKDDKLVFGPDIYGKDKKLVDELAARQKLPQQLLQ